MKTFKLRKLTEEESRSPNTTIARLDNTVYILLNVKDDLWRYTENATRDEVEHALCDYFDNCFIDCDRGRFHLICGAAGVLVAFINGAIASQNAFSPGLMIRGCLSLFTAIKGLFDELCVEELRIYIPENAHDQGLGTLRCFMNRLYLYDE